MLRHEAAAAVDSAPIDDIAECLLISRVELRLVSTKLSQLLSALEGEHDKQELRCRLQQHQCLVERLLSGLQPLEIAYVSSPALLANSPNKSTD